MYNKKASISGLILIISFLVIIYALILPPCDKCRLLDLECSDDCFSDLGKVILSESPGLVYPSSETNVVYGLEPMNLFFRYDPEIRTIIENSQIKRNLFNSKDQSFSFNVDSLENLESLVLSFGIYEKTGELNIELNGHEVFSEFVEENIVVLKLPVDYVEDNNELKFYVTSPDFWSTSYYGLIDISIKTGYEDIYAIGIDSFIIPSFEINNIKKASLSYSMYCNTYSGNNLLKIYLNGDSILSETLSCENLNRIIDLDVNIIKSGVNEIKFIIDNGDYVFSDIRVNSEFNEISYPEYSFNINALENNLVYLDMVFDESGSSANMIINGEEFNLERSSKSFTKDITSMVFVGSNLIKIVPDNSFTIETLKIRIV
ncbi:hypothetical protein HOA59_01775 [archaeon]|jgi:hypothetical protein|nr:hypothetical protein [archaeon]MBT6824145.1 hypothetical protein [archaeon]MBT7107011.1 hypothetical protein [archaeon]MBT7297623.1 hypothetical protein [archaeon]